MRTKIRLGLDFGIQLVLIACLLIQVTTDPARTLQHLGIFAFFISIWQILHAIYVVQKYQDWYRNLYLDKIRRIALFTILIALVGGSVVVTTLGILLPQVLQVLQFLGLGLGVVVAALAFQYFGRSMKNLYDYYQQPRSFWDL